MNRFIRLKCCHAWIHSHLILSQRTKRLAKHLAEMLPENSTVVDIGAGSGKLSSLVLQSRPDLCITGYDTMEWPEQFIEVRLYDGFTIPLSNDACDYCLLSDVLHHCERPLAVLEEVLRVARKGVLIKDHYANSRFDALCLRGMDWFGNYGHGVVLSYSYLSREQWETAFSQLGLRVMQQRTRLGLYPKPITWLFDRNLHFISLLLKQRDSI